MIFAAIQTGEPDPLVGLRGNVGPVEVPWPAWVWVCIGFGAAVLVLFLVWLGYWLAHRKPKPIPPTPRQIALRQLEELRTRAPHTEPYEFSVAVSDVLRTYVSAQYHMRATQQTSPEVLNSISAAAEFTEQDRKLLAAFLERCDLLKFARITAHEEENVELLRAASAFVQSGRDLSQDAAVHGAKPASGAHA
jgi:hypothetical protein